MYPSLTESITALLTALVSFKLAGVPSHVSFVDAHPSAFMQFLKSRLSRGPVMADAVMAGQKPLLRLSNPVTKLVSLVLNVTAIFDPSTLAFGTPLTMREPLNANLTSGIGVHLSAARVQNAFSCRYKVR
jgi:hypothetical protein